MDPEIQQHLSKLIVRAEKKIEDLEISIKLLSLSHMYVQEKHDIYEKMINGINE